MNTITLLSPAKINLTLEVLGTRPDGYHETRSIMQPVSLFDEIKIELLDGDGIELESKGIDVPASVDNLAWKAADMFLKKSGLSIKVKIHLKKLIPIGGGLGGGSSNGAAVLVGLNKLTKRFKDEDLIKFSPKIGADVAHFIYCRSSIAEGIGDKITLLKDFPLLNYILVNPGLEVSTRRIYELWDEKVTEYKTKETINDTISLFSKGELPLNNYLETVAIEAYPEIKELKDMLNDFGARKVSMTGSGPTVFAAFREEKEANIIYNYIRDSSKFKVFLVKGISGWHRL